MDGACSRRQFGAVVIGGVLGTSLSGCGTILYPERRGQPAGPLDWEIVALDAIGLILFFVPGVIAFAVDFSNGTIYLPPGGYGYGYQHGKPPETLRVIPTGRDDLTLARVEQIVSAESGTPVQLLPGEFTSQPLNDVQSFWRVTDHLVASHS